MACHDCMTTYEKNEEVRKEMRKVMLDEYNYYASVDPKRAKALLNNAKKLGDVINRYKFYREPDKEPYIPDEKSADPADAVFDDFDGGYHSMRTLLNIRFNTANKPFIVKDPKDLRWDGLKVQNEYLNLYPKAP